MRWRVLAIGLAIILSGSGIARADAPKSPSFLPKGPEVYNCLVTVPHGYHFYFSRRWPLILFLHGSGERGNDLAKICAQGLPKLLLAGKRIPAIVVLPQCPLNEGWSTLVLSQLIDHMCTKYRVDPDRILVTGLSMGGYGTWEMAQTYPDRFAAIAPMSGGGDPKLAARLRQLPVWAFHGEKDPTVPVQRTKEMIASIQQAGGHPHVTIYPDLPHNCWTEAYSTDALYTWLLAQRRGHAETLTPGVPKS